MPERQQVLRQVMEYGPRFRPRTQRDYAINPWDAPQAGQFDEPLPQGAPRPQALNPYDLPGGSSAPGPQAPPSQPVARSAVRGPLPPESSHIPMGTARPGNYPGQQMQYGAPEGPLSMAISTGGGMQPLPSIPGGSGVPMPPIAATADFGPDRNTMAQSAEHQVNVWNGDRMQQLGTYNSLVGPEMRTLATNQAQQQYDQQQAAMPPALQSVLQPYGGQMPSYQQFMAANTPLIASGFYGGNPYDPAFANRVAQTRAGVGNAYGQLLGAYEGFMNPDTNRLRAEGDLNLRTTELLGHNGTPGSLQNRADLARSEVDKNTAAIAGIIQGLSDDGFARQIVTEAARNAAPGTPVQDILRNSMNALRASGNRQGYNPNTAIQFLGSQFERYNTNLPPGIEPNRNLPALPTTGNAGSGTGTGTGTNETGGNATSYAPASWEPIASDLRGVFQNGTTEQRGIGDAIQRLIASKGEPWVQANIGPINDYIHANFRPEQIAFAAAGTTDGQTPVGEYGALDHPILRPFVRGAGNLLHRATGGVESQELRGRNNFRRMLQHANRAVPQIGLEGTLGANWVAPAITGVQR